MPDEAAPLLAHRRRYHDGCAGCRLDRKKAEGEGRYPRAEICFIWLLTLCGTLPIQSLFPFLYFMIRDLKIAKQEEDIGFYAGFVGCAYMVGRALTAVPWGICADRYGRKPVIVISILSIVIFNSLFGLSSSYWMAITTRGLLGFLCGILGPIKAYATEVVRQEYQATALSVVSSSRAIGLIVGPAVGGYLAQPAEKYPSIFSKSSLFGRFPYFLPCLFISIFSTVCLILCFWLPETLHTHTDEKLNENSVDVLEESLSSYSSLGPEDLVAKGSLLENWPLLSAIIGYCVFALQDMAYAEMFSLWAVSDKMYGGLSFSSSDVGSVLSISGICLLLYQIIVYQTTARLFGPLLSIRTVALLTIPLLSCFPFMTHLSGFILMLVVNCGSFIKNVFSVTTVTWFNILMNDAVSQDKRGAANGMAVTAMSVFKAIAPASAGIIFSWAQKRQDASFLPGDEMIFFALNVVTVLGFIWTFKPFLVVTKKYPVAYECS